MIQRLNPVICRPWLTPDAVVNTSCLVYPVGLAPIWQFVILVKEQNQLMQL